MLAPEALDDANAGRVAGSAEHRGVLFLVALAGELVGGLKRHAGSLFKSSFKRTLKLKMHGSLQRR